MTRRFIIAGIVLLASALVAPPLVAALIDPLPPQPSDTIYPGSLLYLNQGSIWRLDLTSLSRQPFLQETGTIITHVSHSWDRQHVAYSAFSRGPRFEILQSKIAIAGADGSDQKIVVQEDGGATVEWPSWSPDGGRLVYTKSVPSERSQRIEEVDLATGDRRMAVESGSSPTYAWDGQSIVFAAAVGQPWSIWQQPREGGGTVRLVSDAGFADLDGPVYAPDGRVIAFVGARAIGPSDPFATPFALLPALMPVTSAHALPGGQFDVWTVRPDGSGLYQAAELYSEEPYLTWSPDGRYLASWGRQGLQIVDLSTEAPAPVQWVTALAGAGPISWGS
jgi:Tol biopolymer transport system component